MEPKCVTQLGKASPSSLVHLVNYSPVAVATEPACDILLGVSEATQMSPLLGLRTVFCPEEEPAQLALLFLLLTWAEQGLK